jgi:hypothetical protein
MMQTDAKRSQCSQKHKKNWLQIDSVGQKLSTVWGNFSQGAGTPGTQRDIELTAGSERVNLCKSTKNSTNIVFWKTNTNRKFNILMPRNLRIYF